MKTIRIPSLRVAIAGLVLPVAVLALAAGSRTSEAQGLIEMGLDMETTGNTAGALGTVDGCYELAWSGTPFDGMADWTIDVYVAGDTQAPLAYDAWVTYDKNKVHVLQVAPIDPLIKMPGALDLSGYHEGKAAFGAIYLAPPYDGIPGDGTLVRIGLDIGGSGVVAFRFDKGAYVSYPGSLSHRVTTVAARLAINEDCAPAPTPPAAVGGAVELHVDSSDTLADSAAGLSSDSSARIYGALAGGLVAGTVAIAVSAWYARRRWFG